MLLERELQPNLECPRNTLGENSGPKSVSVRLLVISCAVHRSRSPVQYTSQSRRGNAVRRIEVCFVNDVIDVQRRFNNDVLWNVKKSVWNTPTEPQIICDEVVDSS